MKCFQCLAVAFAFVLLLVPGAVTAADDVQKLRAQFEGIVEGLNKNSFEKFNRAIVKDDMAARIYGNRLIEQDVKKAFASDFSASIQQMFVAAFPRSSREILGKLIDFQFDGNQGTAVVRYSASGYRYSYHVYELQRGAKDRLLIVDWIDYYQGSQFSEEAGAALVMASPSRQATRKMLENQTLGDAEIFQVAELFKAVRDNKLPRFFQIADDLDEAVLKDTAIARLVLRFALMSGDKGRIERAVGRIVETHPNDPLYSLRLLEFYIPARQYQQAIDAVARLQEAIGVKDGASESIKASAALAMGDLPEAEAFAVQATELEPGLELSWWSLLRARTRAENYSGATVALERLEDDFGKTLDPATLKRDPFLKALADKQAYLDWRAGRDQAD